MVDIAINKIRGLAFYFYFFFFFVMGCILFLFQILRFGLVVNYYNKRLQLKRKKKRKEKKTKGKNNTKGL